MRRRSAALIGVLLLASCGASPTDPASEEAPLPSFAAGTEWTDTDTLALGDNDDFDGLLMGGPYYAGRQAYGIPALDGYAELRAQTVERAIAQTQSVADAAQKLQDATVLMQEASITFLKDAVATDKTTGKDAMRPVAEAFVSARVRQEALAASIDALVAEPADAIAFAALEYQKTMLALELADSVQADLARSIGICAQLAAGGAGSTDAVKPLAAKLDAACAGVAFSEPLAALQNSVIALGDTLNRIDQADAFFAKAALEAAKQQLPDLQSKVAKLTERDGLDREVIDLATEQLVVMGQLLAQMDATFELPAGAGQPTARGFVPVAYASDYLGSAYDLLQSGAKMAASATKTAAGYTYSGLKAVANAAVTTTGVTVDLTKAAADSATDAILGAADGKSVIEIAQTTRGHFGKVAQNYKNGTSGAQVFKDAGELLEGVEKAGQKAVEDGIASKIGSGWTSWLGGHAAKTTIGMFTGFGKGLYKISDPTSTKGQIAEGALEVGLSFVGGSKVFVKGSQVMKGTGPAMKATALRTLNVMEQQAAKSEIALMRSINDKILKSAKPSPADIERLMMNSRAIEAKEAAVAALNAANGKLDAALSELAKKGGQAIWKNLTVEAQKSFNEFVKESFANSLTGYLKAARSVIGGSMKDYLDNLVAEKGEDAIQALARSIIDGLPLFGIVDFTGTYRGSWATGDVNIPITVRVDGAAIVVEARFTASEEGATVRITLDGKGEAKEDGSASGPLTGELVIAGEETIRAGLTGTFSGTISKEQFSVTANLMAAISGRFWGEDLSGTRPVDPISLVLRREG